MLLFLQSSSLISSFLGLIEVQDRRIYYLGKSLSRAMSFCAVCQKRWGRWIELVMVLQQIIVATNQRWTFFDCFQYGFFSCQSLSDLNFFSGYTLRKAFVLKLCYSTPHVQGPKNHNNKHRSNDVPLNKMLEILKQPKKLRFLRKSIMPWCLLN